jgi:transposase
MGAMPNKTDRNDARGLAQIMRTGWYRAVHVKSPACRSWRALLTAQRMVLNKRRDVENGIRALLREVGLKVGTPSRKDFPARVRELTADHRGADRAGAVERARQRIRQQHGPEPLSLTFLRNGHPSQAHPGAGFHRCVRFCRTRGP